MKKLGMIFLVLAVILTAVTAFADVDIPLGDTGLTIEFQDDFYMLELTDEQTEIGLVGVYVIDQIYLDVYVEDAEGETLDSLLEDFEQDDDVIRSGHGIVTLAGYPFIYAIYSDSLSDRIMYCVSYMIIIPEDRLVTFCYWITDPALSADAAVIMETLSDSGSDR